MVEERDWSQLSQLQNEALRSLCRGGESWSVGHDVQGKHFGRAQASQSLDPMSVPLWGRGRYTGRCEVDTGLRIC